MDEVMTMEEIETRFPEEWILIDRPEKDEFGRIARGRVVFHGPDRDEVYAKALDLPIPRHIAVHCTKKRKPGVAYII
jgi:hypothetical protein